MTYHPYDPHYMEYETSYEQELQDRIDDLKDELAKIREQRDAARSDNDELIHAIKNIAVSLDPRLLEQEQQNWAHQLDCDEEAIEGFCQ